MTADTDDLALERLRYIRKRQDEMLEILGEHRVSIQSLEQHIGAIEMAMGAMQVDIAQIRAGQDRYDDRLRRIEERLELGAGAPA